MPRTSKYTPEQQKAIVEQCNSRTTEEVAKEHGLSIGTIQVWKRNFKNQTEGATGEATAEGGQVAKPAPKRRPGRKAKAAAAPKAKAPEFQPSDDSIRSWYQSELKRLQAEAMSRLFA